MANNATKQNSESITIQNILQALGPLVTSAHGCEPGSANLPALTAVKSSNLATRGHITFVTQPRYLEKALTSEASVICFPEKARETVTQKLGNSSRAYFFSKNPELAMRETLNGFFQKTPYVNSDYEAPIHATAIIHPSAKIGSGVRVGPYAIIGKNVVLADGVVIGAHANVETGATIGSKTVLHPFSYIGHDCVLGAECEIHPSSTIGKEGFGYAHDAQNNHYKIPHTGRVVLGDRVQIGASVTIDRGTFGDTRIDDGAILDNRIHIAHNVEIGANSIITAGFVIAGSSKIGKNFLTGGCTAVTGHIKIADNVQLAGASVVRKDISKPGAYGGNPLLPMNEFMRAMVFMNNVPKLAKKLRSLVVAEDDSQTQNGSSEA